MFEITNHAEKRIKERLGLKGHANARSVAFKAWKAGTYPQKEFIQSKHNMQQWGFTTYIYKQLGNIIFVFQNKGEDLVCLTVYKLGT